MSFIYYWLRLKVGYQTGSKTRVPNTPQEKPKKGQCSNSEVMRMLCCALRADSNTLSLLSLPLSQCLSWDSMDSIRRVWTGEDQHEGSRVTLKHSIHPVNTELRVHQDTSRCIQVLYLLGKETVKGNWMHSM